MYLYYFERILRKAAVDVLGSQCQNLALPYWDYSFNNADQRKLPVPFRTPADPSNVLYVKERNDGINAGASMPSADVNYTQAFQKLNFTSPIGDGNSFGGQRRTDAPHGATPHSVFESRPHDQVHVDVGGWMSQVNRAARDPIFWLHHANIDRLWESWVKLGGGRQNPTTDSDWMNKSFTFFDENGNQVQMRGSQILNTVTQLNYQYSSLAQIPLNVSESMSGDTPKDLIQLGRERVVLPVPSGEIIREAPRRGVSIKLKIEGVEYDPSNLIPYDIYINLPEGATPDPESPYYVGKLALFAYPQGETFTIDITEKVRELQERNVITGDDTKLTIVPSNLVSREQIEERLGRNRSQGNVTFKKVTITVE
jgi:tyrosinase